MILIFPNKLISSSALVFCVVFNQGEFEFSEGEETYDDINDPQYFPGSDSDSDDDYTKVLAKSKLASPKKPLRGNSGTQSDSSVQSTTDAGRRGSGGRGLSICFLCQKEFLKIDAHLRTHIGEDADVAEAFRAPVGSRQRKELLDKLRDRGDSLRSGEVLKAPSPEKPGAECTEEKQQHGTNGVLAVLGHVHEDVAHALSSDFSLELFSKSLYSLHGHNPAKHDFIRQKILELGQFLLTMRKSSPALTLLDAVKPGYFINMVKVVKEMTGFDAAQEIPSLALRIGQSLFEVSDIVQCQALLVGDQDLVDSMTEFKKLYQAKWPEYISQSALSDVVDLTDGSPTEPDPGGLAAQLDQGAESATVAGQNSSSPDQTTNQPTKLPPAEDLGKLHSHLDLKAQSAAAALKEQPIAEDYSSLARATLSKMALLNRGPVGELSKMKVRSFLERECLNKLEEVGLTEYEQKLCCYFQRVGVKGGDGRDVAVLLTPPLVNAIDLMIGKRQECGVPEENDYLFAVPKCRTYYRGHQSLGLFAAECGAEKPDYLRSAKLRKQVATASRIVSFRDHELDQLSSFLGQEVTPQRRFCWLPESTEQSARISKLLLALEKGKLREVQGKSLNDFGGAYLHSGFDLSNAVDLLLFLPFKLKCKSLC